MRKLLFLGVIGGFAAASFGQNLLLNPGFETGDLTGWDAVDVSGFSGVEAGDAHSGTYSFQIGATGSPFDDIQQTVADTAGAQYTLSLWEMDPSSVGLGSGAVELIYNGTVLSDIDPSATYEQVSFVVTGTGSDTIEISGWNAPAFSYVDDASFVAATPEPVSMAVLGIGVVGLIRRRRNRK